MDLIFDYSPVWFPILFLSIAGWIFFSLFTKRGREITSYGGKLIETTGEIDQSYGITSTKIRIHKIQNKKEIESSIVIETTYKMPLAFSLDTMNLSRTEAMELIAALERALKD